MGERILIYLLRRDLRLYDNPIFHEIAQAYSTKSGIQLTHLLPIYVFNATQIEISGFRKHNGEDKSWPFEEARSQVGNFWRCGPHRAKFLAESVWDLKRSLEKAGNGLLIRAGHLPDVIQDALDHYKKSGDDDSGSKVVGIWMTAEEASEEKADERKVREVAEEFGTEFRLFKDEKYFIDE
jgi:deoxyribodipyrimidine photo-lyase